jgi:NAD(P)-dependent dehydrogenase (short-subunit alcohol dehydrogenase family)
MAHILVTGTSSGIGFATALAFGRAGHKVAATMRDPSKASVIAKVAGDENLAISVYTMDVDDDRSVKGAVSRVENEMGPIDVLVNNAGIERMGAVEELPLADFRSVMETNYFGTIRCIQAVMPAMRQRRSGCIINVASVAGHIAASSQAAYAASKFAVEALSECLAQEAKPFNIRVAIVEPGIIDTPMAQRIGSPQSASHYPQQNRMAAMFTSVLKNPVLPSLVADKIQEIAVSGTWQLRHPVGPDALPFLAWRKAMTDEEWVTWGSLSDEAWYARVKAEFGIDACPQA